MRRLAIAIRSWQDCLRGVTGDSAVDTMDTTTSTPQLPHKLGGTPALQARFNTSTSLILVEGHQEFGNTSF